MVKKNLFVWMDGQKARLKNKHASPDKKYTIKEFNREQAASIDDSDIPELVKRKGVDGNDSYYSSRKSKLKPFKPLLLASISAIIIGSFLGIVMLQLFVDIDKRMSQQNASIPMADDNDKKNETEQMETATIESQTAFVLQAGKFTEKPNADKMAKAFQQAGFAAMIWKKNDSFFVLSGIAETEEHASHLADTMTDKGLKVYVKPWKTSEKETRLQQAEKKWLQTYRTQWNKALETVSKGNNVAAEGWKGVVGAIPEKQEHIKDLTSSVKKAYENMKKTDKWKDHAQVLRLWKQFHQTVTN
ncbi:hypothetical protein GCM10008983_19320 [Lentibacillus halophilus]|uniref:SPOR domain-containing protein n=1 Tax=Lentibacillus halophilus TaxID=295065 RepID=A0ABN0ZBE8_9BACI